MLNAKSLFILLLTFIFAASSARAQRSQSKKNNLKSAQSSAAKLIAKTDDKALAAFETLKNAADATERIEKLNKFIVDFPGSELKIRAIEMLIISHIEIGEASFRSVDKTSGANHFRRAAAAYQPIISDNIFNDVIAKLPFNLFFRGEQLAALEVAREIELKINDNAERLLALTNFYLSTENADDAKRLATRAAQIAPDSAAAQMSLGMAHRIAFHLEAASQAYARAVELDPSATLARRNWADALRGLGQTEDALKLYRELLTANAADEAARNGLILTLLSAGNLDEAEKELVAALEQNPKNFVLQTGAAYWYAANGAGARAVELAQKAVETEPRYVWGQIALARGLILEKRPLEAERALLAARQYGKFPTLDYELASAHLAAGLYDEAADDLRRSFAIRNGKLETKLAGRSQSEADSFIELLSRERRASIFEPKSAGGEIEARKLKELLVLTEINRSESLNKNVNENAFLKAAQDFAGDADEMQVYRELYAANKLLNRKIAVEQILEMTRSATTGLEKSLDVSAATAAVLADELYAPRRLAAVNGELVNIPVLPRETLRQIMRGKVEEIAGWTLYQQSKPDEAVVRLRRAVGVLPENSAWWRSSYWKLGAALDASGKSKDALEAYLKSYQADVPNETRLIVIKALYERLYGSLDGLDARLSRSELGAQATAALRQTAAPRRTLSATTAFPTAFKNPLPNVIAEIKSPSATETPKSETLSAVQATSELTTEPATPEQTENSSENSTLATPENKEATVLRTVTTPPEEKISETKSVSETIAAPILPAEPLAQSSPAPDTKAMTEAETENSNKIVGDSEIKIEDKIEDEVKDKVKTDVAPVTESLLSESPLTEIKLPPPLNQNIESAANKSDLTQKSADAKEPSEKSANDERAVSNLESVPTEKIETDSALARPRVIIRSLNPPIANTNQTEIKNENAAKPVAATTAACLMQPSQTELSLLRNGGTMAFLVMFNNAEDAAKLNVSVSSPSDLSVILMPLDAANGDHRFVQVSSISEITKTFSVNLESACGKQEIKVKVR